MTTKVWHIPPRPRPGRKPATDTPPTKRKAQNRAAQRAFRERRAARVGELEEQLEETKEEQQKRENELRDNITRLEAEIFRFNGELQSWRLRCDTLDQMVEYERREKEAALLELSYLRHGSNTTGTDAVPLPPRRARRQEARITTEIQQDEPIHREYQEPEVEQVYGCGNCTATTNCACAEQALAITTNGCGNCSPETHCQCLEATINAADNISMPTDLKRAHSPTEYQADKRYRQSDPPTPNEVDFTAQFSSKPTATHVQPSPQVHIMARPSGESCGFCEEGSYCMCAEAAAAVNQERDNENRLAPLLHQVTPPPSDTDVEGSVKLPGLHPNQMHRPLTAPVPANSCVNGPGTCQQCLSDPKSGLFCRSLAAMRDSSTSAVPDGCCGGNAGGGGCCKSLSEPSPSQPPPSLSVADTYKTLSTHQNFDQATDELGTWLGRLHATPSRHPGRNAMEVEAASVMGVLKLFDRRFGRG
jgi:hypothetical protein